MTEEERIEQQRDADLYLEFGDGNISVLTTKDNKIILSRQMGMGTIGKKNPATPAGSTYIPSADDVVMKFKSIESLLVVKDAIESIEKSFLET